MNVFLSIFTSKLRLVWNSPSFCNYFHYSLGVAALSESYYKLKKYGQAEALLTDMLARADIDSPHKESRKTSSLMLCLKGSLLLSKVQNLLGTSGTLAEVLNSLRFYLL